MEPKDGATGMEHTDEAANVAKTEQEPYTALLQERGGVILFQVTQENRTQGGTTNLFT